MSLLLILRSPAAGGATIVEATGSAVGAAVGTGKAAAIALAAGASTGLSTDTGRAAAVALSTGASQGLATDTGLAAAVPVAVGSSIGLSTDVAQGAAIALSTGSSVGVSVVTGVSDNAPGSLGESAGTSVALGVSSVIVSSEGLSAGLSVALGESDIGAVTLAAESLRRRGGWDEDAEAYEALMQRLTEPRRKDFATQLKAPFRRPEPPSPPIPAEAPVTRKALPQALRASLVRAVAGPPTGQAALLALFEQTTAPTVLFEEVPDEVIMLALDDFCCLI